MGRTTERRRSLDQLLNDPPLLHNWRGRWKRGGLADDHLRTIHALLHQQHPDGGHVVFETGAGLSTLVFLATAPQRLVTIAPDTELRDRILAQCEHFGIDTGPLEYHVARSEEVLPVLTEAPEPFIDLALIDGAHGYPTPFVDFCYLNRALKRGGHLLVDDTQLHAVRELALTLRHQPGWEHDGSMQKLIFVRKRTDARYLPDFAKQPYSASHDLPNLGRPPLGDPSRESADSATADAASGG